MKEKDRRLGLVAFALGITYVVSGCSVLKQAAANTLEFKATLYTKGASVDCFTDTNPSARTEEGKTHVVLKQAFCFDGTPNAREITGMPLSEPLSGEFIVGNIGVIEKVVDSTNSNPQGNP